MALSFPAISRTLLGATKMNSALELMNFLSAMTGDTLHLSVTASYPLQKINPSPLHYVKLHSILTLFISVSRL